MKHLIRLKLKHSKKNFASVLICLAILGTSSMSLARSPSSIDMSYDDKEKNLHIVINHVTQDPREHYIRRLLVYKNDQNEPTIYRYVQQTNTQTQTEDVSIDLQAGDSVKVEAICVEAGRAKKVLVVPSEDTPEKK